MPVIFYNDTENGVQVLSEQIDCEKVTGVDKNWPAHFLLQLMKYVQPDLLLNGSEITDHIRSCKDKEEIQSMKEVSKDNDIAMGKLKELLSEQFTEQQMTHKLGKIYQELGNSGFSFDPVVAYGTNAADPHHMTDDSLVMPGDSIVIDIGGVKNSYCSDMTRTFFYKEVSEKSREVYETVREANQRAIDKIQPGVQFCEIDAAARDYITEKGYGQYFTHRTGHFIGIECHETGDVSASNPAVVEPGMIFSIEPGIYIPGEVGVRIEDLVLATDTGVELLNHYPKELTIID